MTDRYANIRRALAMGPTPGPYWQYEHAPQRVYTQSGAISISWTCNSDNGALEAKAEATAAHIAACDPDTIRELMAEMDALAEGLSDTEKDVAVAQAVEFAEYVERQAKGVMREAARRFLSLPYSQEVAERLMERDALLEACCLAARYLNPDQFPDAVKKIDAAIAAANGGTNG